MAISGPMKTGRGYGDITLAQLRAFLETHERGSFTAASQSLGVTQASVSELVTRLEKDLGAKLFDRLPRGVAITQVGEELLPYAQRIQKQLQEASQRIRSHSNLLSGTASFGVPRNARYYGAKDVALQFNRDYPNLQLRLLGVNSYLVARAISRGELEAGLVVLPVPTEGLKLSPLAHHEVLLASAQPIFEDVTMQSIADMQLILYDAHVGWLDPTRRLLQFRAEKEGISLSVAFEVETVDTALDLVAAGAGVTLVNESLVHAGMIPEGVKTYSFSEPFIETLALAQHSMLNLSPATEALAGLVRQRVAMMEEDSTPDSGID